MKLACCTVFVFFIILQALVTTISFHLRIRPRRRDCAKNEKVMNSRIRIPFYIIVIIIIYIIVLRSTVRQ